jgi:hypothetical protein
MVYGVKSAAPASDGLGNTAARGGDFLGLAQIVRMLTMLASTRVIVRLLTPSEYRSASEYRR